MGTAFDIEEETVCSTLRVPDGNDGRVARRPKGKLGEGSAVGRRIRVSRLQIHNFRSRIRQQVTKGQAILLGGTIESDHARAAVAGSDQHQGHGRIDGVSWRCGSLRPKQACDRPSS
jgi:hypothetical protein